MAKRTILPAVAGVILLLSTVSIIRTQPVQANHEPPNPPPVSEFESRVAGVGLVEANTENISIGSHLPGVVDKVYVKVGDAVKKGAALVKLDTRALESALALRQAELTQRQAALGTAKANAARSRAVLSEAQRNLKFAEAADSRSISAEEVTRRRSAVEIGQAEVATAEAQIVSANADVEAGQAAVSSVQTDLDRSIVTAPVEGQVLQLRVRPGEFVTAGPASPAWLLVGNVNPLHVRVDIDEHEAWRVQPGARATAHVRGNATLVAALEFVRLEPYVLPKVSLTGASNERVDTRVLQAVYRVAETKAPLFVGQQLDVFIEANQGRVAAAR